MQVVVIQMVLLLSLQIVLVMVFGLDNLVLVVHHGVQQLVIFIGVLVDYQVKLKDFASHLMEKQH